MAQSQGCSLAARPALFLTSILTYGARFATCATILVPRTSNCSTHPASEVPCPGKHVSSLTLLAAIGIPVLIVVIAIGGYIFHVFRRPSNRSNKIYDTVPPSSTALLQTMNTKSERSFDKEAPSPTTSDGEEKMISYSDSVTPQLTRTTSTVISEFGTTPRTKTKDDASSSVVSSQSSPPVRGSAAPETAETMYGYGVGVI